MSSTNLKNVNLSRSEQAASSSHRPLLSYIMLSIVGYLAIGCGLNPSASPAIPTRSLAPTFTATAVAEAVQVDQNAASATKVALAASNQNSQPNTAAENTGVQPAADNAAPAPAVDTPTPEPTATPLPQVPEAVVQINLMNVRSGPGINYSIVGAANQGDRFPVTGKDPASTWWQIDFNGQPAWVFGELVSAENIGDIGIAANIPPSPVPPPPTNTPVPPPPAPTAPPAPAAPQYEFNVALVSRCDPQAAGTWFSGKTYKNGNPANGYRVVFSFAPDGQPATNPMISGPHEGYNNWDTGYYSHIISANEPKSGTWYVWIVDAGGARISEIASFTTDGSTNTCNQAIVDFDSR